MNKKGLSPPHAATRLLLRIALPLILLSAVTLLCAYLDARANSVPMANLTYRPYLEYILAALAVTSAGAVLLEAVARDVK